MVLRHLVAVLVLPVTVVVVIPWWIGDTNGIAPTVPAGGFEWAGVVAGSLLGLVGSALFCASLFRFGVEGRGTLAPWDPPRALVVSGPYAYVRNPMISGVILLLCAQAMILRSKPHAGWALTFLVINAVYIPVLEEPMLRARFGDAYRHYAENVPRLLPRIRPWRAGDGSGR